MQDTQLKTLKITAMRQAIHADLVERYENPLENPCCVTVGQSWVSVGGEMPEEFCAAAWETLRPFVAKLARGEGNFYDGWMKDPMTALLSCNDGFRPVSFLLEVVG